MYGYGYRYNSGLVIGAGGGAPFANTSSILFDGVDDYVNVGNDSSLDLTTMSISFWVKYLPYAANKVLIGKRYQSSYSVLSANGGDITFYTNGTPLSTGSIGVNDGVWHHVLCNVDASSKNIYVDGILKATGASVLPTIDTTSLYIGNAGGFFAPFIGKIDEVSIYNTAKAIGDLWDGSGKPTDLTAQSGLVSWWRMGDGVTAFPTIPDVIGTNDGTAYNENEATMVVPDVP